ncbi:MAG: hypothetical protein ABI378_13555 [Chitinophagaceae bacterium]
MRSKRFLMLTISLLILAFPVYKIVVACSDGPDPYDYYPQFFPPTITAQPSFIPFQYTAQIKYYDDWYSYTSEDEIPDANIAAWRGFTGNSVPIADLDSFIYKFSWTQLNQLYKNIEKGTVLSSGDEISSNGFSKFLQQKKDLETLGYLMYAKQCEPYVAGGDGDWELPANDTAKMSKLLKSGQQLYAVCKQDFIKERFAYQVLRMAFHEQKYAQVLKLYSSMIGDEKEDGSEIFVRCLGIKAGTLFRLKRKPEAAYLFSLVFDKSTSKRSSFISFDWAAGNGILKVLPLCKNNHERAVLQVMDGLRTFSEALPQIKTAYAADPNMNGLDVLVTREINKIEERYQQEELLAQRNLSAYYQYTDRYWGNADNGQPNQTPNRWKNYAKQVNDFCLKAATEGKSSHPAFWHLASAYLYFVQGDLANSKHYLEVATQDKMSNREHDLHDVIKTLLIIRSTDKMNAATEASLLPLLRWMDERGAKNPEFDKTYRDLMSTVLTSAYLHSGDTTKAIFCLARVTRSQDGKFTADEDFMDLPGSLLERLPAQKVKEVQAFLEKKNKSDFDAWLVDKTPYTANVLTELEGTKYLRTQQFALAATTFKKIPATTLLPNPFVAHIQDVMDLAAEDTIHQYSKLGFAQKMAELSTKTDAQSLFAYGEGLYSMSYYGKAHHASDYYRSAADESAYYATPERAKLPKSAQEYYSVAAAEKAFVQAASKTTDAELKAKCNWMAAKCWQKSCPASKAVSSWEREEDKSYYHNALKNPYFKDFRDENGKTKYGIEVLNTCDYLKDYLKQK